MNVVYDQVREGFVSRSNEQTFECVMDLNHVSILFSHFGCERCAEVEMIH